MSAKSIIRSVAPAVVRGIALGVALIVVSEIVESKLSKNQ